MQVYYSDEPFPKMVDKASIFLAGPTPRGESVESWRPHALELLKMTGFNGDVFVPERRDWKVKFDYTDQVEWEEKGLKYANKIVFWVPRKAPNMLALTTNLEFGYSVATRPDAVIYGRPDEAENIRYLDWFFERHTNRKPKTTLQDTLLKASL